MVGLGNVKLISCLVLHGKKFDGWCAKIILFFKKIVNEQNEFSFLFYQFVMEKLFYEIM